MTKSWIFQKVQPQLPHVRHLCTLAAMRSEHTGQKPKTKNHPGQTSTNDLGSWKIASVLSSRLHATLHARTMRPPPLLLPPPQTIVFLSYMRVVPSQKLNMNVYPLSCHVIFCIICISSVWSEGCISAATPPALIYRGGLFMGVSTSVLLHWALWEWHLPTEIEVALFSGLVVRLIVFHAASIFLLSIYPFRKFIVLRRPTPWSHPCAW